MVCRTIFLFKQKTSYEMRISDWSSDVCSSDLEIKVPSADFPAAAVAAFGYPYIEVHGQKGYNGVAILSRQPLQAPSKQIWCDRDDCRHLAVTVGGVELHNFYVPAGGDVPDPELNGKFDHKPIGRATWRKKE